MFKNLRGDLLGGITAGIVALPLALAFGVQSGMGASAGLYGAIFIAFFAALFGGTATQISGPTAPMTAVSLLAVANILGQHDGDLSKALPYILIVFFLAGILQIFFGVIRLGVFVKFIPYPVVSGFMSGIGVIILITQIPNLVGYKAANDASLIESFIPKAKEVVVEKSLKKHTKKGVYEVGVLKDALTGIEKFDYEIYRNEAKNLLAKDSSGVIGALKYLPSSLKNINMVELVLAIITIVIIYGFKRITTVVPSTLVALFIVTIGALLFLKEGSYGIIGNIPSGFPKPNIAIFGNVAIGKVIPFITTAVSLALLGTIDSLLTSVVADNMTKTKHNSNKELIGQGIGNAIAAIFGGIPGAGATIRTVVNINSGGKTKLSGMIAGILLLLVLLVLGPYAKLIPNAVLAGILITVGIGVMDYKGLKAVKKMSKSEVFVMFLVLILTVFWDLIYAVGAGVIVATFIFMKEMSVVTEENSYLNPFSFTRYNPAEDLPDEYKGKVYMERIRGALFFGATDKIQELSKQVPREIEIFVLNLRMMPYIDQSGLNTLEEIIKDLKNKGITVVFLSINRQPKSLLTSNGVIPNIVPDEFLMEDYHEFFEWINKK